jgi:cell division protein FtsL
MKKLIIALIIGLIISSPALAYSQYAFWTGRSERTTTMNYQEVLNCEYSLGDGRTFWRTFAYSCAAQVRVD